jgi:very-short-patch-repair endonuclease
MRRSASAAELRRTARQAAVLGLDVGDNAIHDRTRSELERDFLRLCQRHRLPMPETNVLLGGMEVDFLWRSRHLVVETDGYRYHRGNVAFEDDRRRDLALRALGFEVLRLSYRQVNESPKQVAAVLERMLQES